MIKFGLIVMIVINTVIKYNYIFGIISCKFSEYYCLFCSTSSIISSTIITVANSHVNSLSHDH